MTWLRSAEKRGPFEPDPVKTGGGMRWEGSNSETDETTPAKAWVVFLFLEKR